MALLHHVAALLVSVTVCLGTERAGVPPVAISSGSRDICKGLECPQFTVLNTTDKWELRHYPLTKWVATNATAMNKQEVGRTMFRRLFQYISGANAANVNIDMTAPVATKAIPGQGPNCESEFIMHFMLPFTYWQNPILPTNPAVYIVQTPPMDVYVRHFGGFATDDDYLENLATLSTDLSTAEIAVEGSFFFMAGYDGPYTFINRRNEVWIVKQ
ncbi:heme-binding protein 2-like [Plakobranchus ocellatus]|uniref:Heme-binding protein 2-like n=1 Tax=Plakobranchus ocellatus TaxID=259542 RepID=A0AAV3Z8B7_9GAST|nr:heme-binding protein 2-like [Plakobranchus ocellatus]